MAAMLWAVSYGCSVYSAAEVFKYYFIPWLEVSHWCTSIACIVPGVPKRLNCHRRSLVIMITYLHHTDPTLPHYRGKEWNFQRGAAATVDRPFLGWQGRFFLHDVAHYHVIHHVSAYSFYSTTPPLTLNFTLLQFFPKIPFCKDFRTGIHLQFRIPI